MNDCPNTEMRDALPDLFRPDMDADERARVEAHVATCAECAAEVALLERVRAEYAGVPARIDANRVAQALPVRSRRVRWVASPALRMAATLALLIGGATWYAANTGRSGDSAGSPTGQVAVVTGQGADSVRAGAGRTDAGTTMAGAGRRAAVTPGLSLDGSLEDFSDAELQSLLAALDSFEAEVGIEPDAVVPVLDREVLQ